MGGYVALDARRGLGSKHLYTIMMIKIIVVIRVMSEITTSIPCSVEVRDAIKSLGVKGDSYDKILRRMLVVVRAQIRKETEKNDASAKPKP